MGDGAGRLQRQWRRLELFPARMAPSRAYRWGEDGIGGISDFRQRLCFAFAFWNERDPILKERLFGVTGPQGNHGEDVKEIFFFEDNTPTHSYMRMTYRYPQAPFPYQELVRQNAQRSKMEPEFELWDTGILRENRFFDITIEYAKAADDDFLIRATATNRGPERAPLHLVRRFGFAIPGAGAWIIGGQPCIWATASARGLQSCRQTIMPSAITSSFAKTRLKSSSPKTKATCNCSSAYPTPARL